METTKKVKILKIYVSSTDKVKHASVYEALAFQAKRYGLAGATVYKGIMGYGASSELHSNKFWELTEKIPVIVEIVDEEDKINNFIEKVLPILKGLPKGCLIASQDTEVILAKQGNTKK